MGWLGNVLLVLPEVNDESGDDGEEQEQLLLRREWLNFFMK